MIQRYPEPTGFSISDGVAAQCEGSTLIFVSGQIGLDENNELVPGGLGAEARACFDRMATILSQCQGQLTDIVRITAYVTTFDHYADYGSVRSEVFGESLPSSSTVKVAGLLNDAACIEIDAIAIVPGRDGTG